MSGIAHDQPQSVKTCFLGLLDYSIFKLQKSSKVVGYSQTHPQITFSIGNSRKSGFSGSSISENNLIS
jgi:hypothetical protein